MSVVRRTAFLVVAVLLAACAVRVPPPVTLPLPDVRPPSHLNRIHDYQGALAAIAAVFERELGVAPFPVTVHFLTDDTEFEAALIAAGEGPASARATASVMGAVGMHGQVLFKYRAIDSREWPDRVRMLAHELVHSLQYALTGGIRGASEQWLREGFAEWVALLTVDRLGGPALQDLRDQQWAVFQATTRSQAPRLDDMVTFAQWVPLFTRRDIAQYSQAFLAVDLLVERHGAPAIIEYFRRFGVTRDRHAAFRAVFGETQADFEKVLNARLGIRRTMTTISPTQPLP